MTTETLVGYARTSTQDQKAGLDAQLRDLELEGCTKVFHEELSSVARQRPELERALDYVRSGDTFVVTKLDRLARSVTDLVSLVGTLKDKGVNLRILQLNLDTETPTGKLMVHLMGAIAEFERDLMLERQREGIEKARQEGKYKGRKATAREKSLEVLHYRQQGISAEKISEKLKISRASVYRILANQKTLTR